MNADPPPSEADGRQGNNHNELGTKQDDDASNTIEGSYEILSNSSASTTAMDTVNQCEEVENEKSDIDDTLNTSHRITTDGAPDSHKESFQSSRRKSNSFLSRFQSSSSPTSNNETPPTNLPSSLANAFSSLTSSFASGFNLASSSNGNTHSNNISASENVASNLTIETISTSTGASIFASETREQILHKKATYERKNLINLTKLIVKDLISSSLSAGRTIDENHCAIHLNNYFTLIDRVLKHGLRQNILSNKSASLWNALDNLPKYLTDKRLTSETVRSLAHTKSSDGKIKAWVRIAMMQKKLPDYLNELLAKKSFLLKDVYYDYAFMMNDEALVFAGLIIGVNVIDCNFFVKDDNFDAIDDVIDLSPYLKAANTFDEDDQIKDSTTQDQGKQLENLTAVLDQKNYLEERSKHLESTIVGLHSKIKQLEELNSRLEIDAKVNEVRIQKLQKGDAVSEKSSLTGVFPIPDALRGLMSPSNEPRKSEQISTNTTTSDLLVDSNTNAQTNPSIAPNDAIVDTQSASVAAGDNFTSETPDTGENLCNLNAYKGIADNLERFQKLSTNQEKELSSLRERVSILETNYRGALDKIRVLERDLDVQISMNKDKETTIKIYEKDLREKQTQVESLRLSLTDTKKLNTDLNERLNDTSVKLKERLSSVTNLQTSLDKWKIENKTLFTRLQDKQIALKSVNGQLEQALKTVEDLKKYNEKINDDLRKERECGQSSSITVDTQTAKINELVDRLRLVEGELSELRSNKENLEEFKRKCREYEQSLEEVGYQLRESRLEVESLKENSSVFLDSQWMDSKQVKNCALCQLAFSVTRRKHHCRLCGNVFCQTCSDNKMELASSSKPARVCDTCHAFLLAKFVKSSSLTLTNKNSSAKS